MSYGQNNYNSCNRIDDSQLELVSAEFNKVTVDTPVDRYMNRDVELGMLGDAIRERRESEKQMESPRPLDKDPIARLARTMLEKLTGDTNSLLDDVGIPQFGIDPEL